MCTSGEKTFKEGDEESVEEEVYSASVLRDHRLYMNRDLSETGGAVMGIDRSWNGRLVTLQQRAMHLQYLFACLSTLGGAYHLCNHPRTALQIARKQGSLALVLGSSSQLLRAKVYQAVNLYLLGFPNKSRKLFQTSIQEARHIGNEDMVRFAEASWAWTLSPAGRSAMESARDDDMKKKEHSIMITS